MSSKKPNHFLVVLDVGHGSAAVLHDEGGIVVFDTGKGAHVGRHLAQSGVRKIHAMFLSHADEDHIGGAVTVLLDKNVQVAQVFLNPDPTKSTVVFEQLRYALADASLRNGTKIEPKLTTSTKLRRKGAAIEILHPPDVVAVAGVGGKSDSGKQLTSNSMSAAIRVSCSAESSILLGGDIEYDCVERWKTSNLRASATVLVFPHHGGLPGSSDESEAELFSYEITKLVSPKIVVFSNHRTKHNNPRECVLKAIAKTVAGVRFVCTQLPQRIHQQVEATGAWSLHKSGANVIEGSICLVLQPSDIEVSFGEKPVALGRSRVG